MNLDEASRVLAKAAGFDRRTVGQADVLAWQEALNDIPVDDALQAVTVHYRDTTDWLMPAHVRRHAATIDRDRRRAARELDEHQAIEAYRGQAGPLTDRRAEIRDFVGQVREVLPEGDREALHPRRTAWEREHEAFQRQQGAEPNPNYDPTLDAPPPWQVNAGTENGAWWEDDRARERHAQELLSAAGRLRPRTTRETS